MGAEISLTVIMPAVPRQRWSCHSCGDCCRSLVAHLFDADRKRIDEQDWRDELGVVPYVRAGRGYVLNKRQDGEGEACVFLDADNRCMIHSRFGEEAKPLACRIFPFSVTMIDGAWQASLRFDCPSVTGSKGESLGGRQRWLGELARSLPAVARGRARQPRPRLAGRLRATSAEERIVGERFAAWFSKTAHDPAAVGDRLLAAARLTVNLGQARLAKVRGERLGELLDVLIGASSSMIDPPPGPCTPKQLGMLRQLAFVHAEHVSLADRRSGLLRRIAIRADQLRRGRIFRRGEGVVPPLPGWTGTEARPTGGAEARFIRAPHPNPLAGGKGATGAAPHCSPLPGGEGVRDGGAVWFDEVERIAPAVEDASRVAELLSRYIVARFAGRTVFGRGYYGRSVVGGLTSLWLAIACVGWIARYTCARRGGERLSFDDVSRALGVVDRAATRSPSLGTTAERARALFFHDDDGLPRAVRAMTVVAAHD